MIARPATPADAAELVRLRAVLLRSMSQPDWNDDWRGPAHESLTARLGGPTLAGFVVDRPADPSPDPAGPDGPGLAACALGIVEHRLGNPFDPHGRVGYIFSVATDPDQRRRGYSRACVTALLDWYRDHDIRTVDLRASAEAEPLYRDLGFTRTSDPAMRLRL
jgi:GNAT superfamily N-acetyltransferase